MLISQTLSQQKNEIRREILAEVNPKLIKPRLVQSRLERNVDNKQSISKAKIFQKRVAKSVSIQRRRGPVEFLHFFAMGFLLLFRRFS